MRPVKTTRMFDGKRYNLAGYWKNKREAEEKRDKNRKKGFYARLVKHHKLGYVLYIR